MQRRPPYPAKPRVFSVFNPAITEAPRGLCPRCTYVLALRVDAMHQCNASSPLLRRNMPQSAPGATTSNRRGPTRQCSSLMAQGCREIGAWFKGTALAVLDADRRLLGWTWLLPRPENQAPSPPQDWRRPWGRGVGIARPRPPHRRCLSRPWRATARAGSCLPE